MKSFLWKLWRWYLARFRLSMDAVCEQSVGREAWNDYHDYDDSEHGEPWHCIELKCTRCGKAFTI